jgi:hypothetical protein
LVVRAIAIQVPGQRLDRILINPAGRDLILGQRNLRQQCNAYDDFG